MRLGLALGPGEGDFSVPIETVKLAERLGYDSVWTAETYGADALTPLAFIAAHTGKIRLGTAIAQLDSRSPANFMMTSQTIDRLAGGGRMILGLGVSGPQIVEGWYGRPWGKPNTRLRDYVSILRKMAARQEPVTHEGKELSLPYAGTDSAGLGKPLRTFLHTNPDLPIYLGTATPLNVRMTGEIADGWLGFHLVPALVAKYRALLEEGLAKRSDGRSYERFPIQGMVGVKLADDVAAAINEPKAHIALYAGGMGAKAKNFHKEALIERGFGEAAERIQELYLAGRKDEAAAAVPDEYVDDEWLIGPPARIAERFKLWRDSGIDDLCIRISPPEIVELIAKVAFA
jgi:F420-dependent oxidoreductase-like protein